MYNSIYMENNAICAVIVSFNEPFRLKECVLGICGQVDMIVVVDNGDGKGLDDITALPACSGKIRLIRNRRNEGLAAALNQGIRYSLDQNHAWTLLMDQDSVAAPTMVQEMLSSLGQLNNTQQEQTAMVVPVVSDRNYGEIIPSIITTGFLNRKIRLPVQDEFVHFHITSGSLLKNSLIPVIGMMDERFFIDYIDFDYCFRILDSGFKILLSRDALLYHSLAETKRKLFFHYREHQPVRVYYQTKNSLYTIYKYGRKYRSFLYFEIFRLVRRPIKTILWESQKSEKIFMFYRGIRDFVRKCGKLDAD